MITRYNYEWKKPERVSSPIKEDYELIKIIEPISFNDDKTIKEYKENDSYKLKKSKWCDFIKSFDLGSVSDQVFNHLKKGTPLVTAHTLPSGDYTSESLLKGAEIKREMSSKGITLEMIYDALTKANEKKIDSSESEVANG